MFISVAVPVPSLDPLTYRLPDHLAVPQAGARVLVPVGARTLTGCVLGMGEPGQPPGGVRPEDVRDVIDILDDEAFLPREVLELIGWVAQYYAAAAGDVVAAAVPPRAWVASELRVALTPEGRERAAGGSEGSRGAMLALLSGLKDATLGQLARVRSGSSVGGGARRQHLAAVRATVRLLEREGLVSTSRPLRGTASAFQQTTELRLTAEGAARLGLEGADGVPPAPEARVGNASGSLGRRQRAVLARLAEAGGRLAGPFSEPIFATDTLRRLAAQGLVELQPIRVERDPFETLLGAEPSVSEEADPTAGARALTPEQTAALRRLSEWLEEATFGVVALQGVTGSGKTELYLRAARETVSAGRRVLLLVPEIALTPIVARLFRRAFGPRVAIQHSGLSDGERHDQWHRIRRGEVAVVIGTRSAVFAPLPDLGLVIVDEEHDPSYKQEETPRYHGRDVAIVRAKAAGALVVLGSATPSLETGHNAACGRYERVVLRHRVLERPLAAVRLVDMREEYAARGADVVLSRPLAGAISARLDRGDQSLVLLNRRGFAASVFCRQCAGTIECPNCSVSLTVHLRVRRARCHYCGFSRGVPSACPSCGGPYLEQMGFGTQRVEDEVRRLFPAARVARLDRDAVRRKGVLLDVLVRFARREIDVLVGTQMIAKGHDFPDVTLVGVVSADVGLGLADFRAGERTFQLLTQVAGRAGRGTKPGEAIIQTLYPEHYSIQLACRQDYHAFFDRELAFRKAMKYPPVLSMINVVVRAADLRSALADADLLVGRLRRQEGFRTLGPAPAPLQRLRGEARAQLFLKGEHRSLMRESLLRVLAEHPEIRRRAVVDVDPLSML